MNDRKRSVAEACLQGAERGTKTFPEIVATLIGVGFEAYSIDFRRAVATYYTPDGDTVEVPAHTVDVSVAQTFDADAVRAAIQEAQRLVPGYTYLGFCRQIVQAGCAGYFVSFLGRRVLYVGRTGETLVEPFPDAGT